MDAIQEIEFYLTTKNAEPEWILERGLKYAIHEKKPDVFEWLMREVQAWDRWVKTDCKFEDITDAEVDYKGYHYIQFTLKSKEDGI